MGLECECGGPPQEVEHVGGHGGRAGVGGVQLHSVLAKAYDGVVDGAGAWECGGLFEQGLAVFECEQGFFFPLRRKKAGRDRVKRLEVEDEQLLALDGPEGGGPGCAAGVECAEDGECLRGVARLAGREDGCAEEGGGEEAAGFAVVGERGLGGERLEERDGCEVGLEGERVVGRGRELVGETLETAGSQPVDDCGVAVEHAETRVGGPVDGVVHPECGVVGCGGMEVVCQGELCGHELGGGEIPAGHHGLEIARAVGGVVCCDGGPPCVAAAPRTLVAGVVAVEVGGAEVGGGGVAGGGVAGGMVCGGEVEEGDVAQVVYEACVWGEHGGAGGSTRG